jgi:electron transport complex protein RnfE
LTNGILKENPTLILMLGMCPALAVTTSAGNAIGMGLSTTFVLICSNIVISMVKNFIPPSVRLPSYIVIISGFVTIVSLVLQAYLPDLNKALGIYVSLIVVNCIILARAEIFASKNTVGASMLDGIGMGIGLTLAMLAIGTAREIFGSGTWFGLNITFGIIPQMKLFILPAGGFFVFGLISALVNRLNGYVLNKKQDCDYCPNALTCMGRLDDDGNYAKGKACGAPSGKPLHPKNVRTSSALGRNGKRK